MARIRLHAVKHRHGLQVSHCHTDCHSHFGHEWQCHGLVVLLVGGTLDPVGEIGAVFRTYVGVGGRGVEKSGGFDRKNGGFDGKNGGFDGKSVDFDRENDNFDRENDNFDGKMSFLIGKWGFLIGKWGV
jgi:hypothetical protein